MENLNKLEPIEKTEESVLEKNNEAVGLDLARFEPIVTTDTPGCDEVVVTSDPYSVADTLDSNQGDNIFGYQGNCGLVSISNLLQLSGIPATEDDVTAVAINNNLCDNNPFLPPSSLGGTNFEQRLEILDLYGVEADVFFPNQPGGTYEDIATALESGQCVLMSVNAGYLWDDPNSVMSGSSNHVITVTSPVRDADTGEIVGFYICDSGRCMEEDSSRFVSVEELDASYAYVPNTSVIVTEQPTRVL